MELKYVLLIIIKILISVPVIFLYQSQITTASTLMGGHLNNTSGPVNKTDLITDYYDSEDFASNSNSTEIPEENSGQYSEEVPDPSALVLPGYNLPENIFNKGKPFYLEKDPLTGTIDFDTKAEVKLDDDMYEYVEDEPSSDIYDKANIDRKDGSLSSHRPSDVNQLTPNFHDFLNLPVKYNSDKYVYPLISSSYANTKVQGNVNKYHNHKDYNIKTLTYKPTGSPTYFSSTKNNFNAPTQRTTTSTTTTTTTTPRTTTEIHLTSKSPNPMLHPSFHEDFEDYVEPTEIYFTTKNTNNIYLTSTTTKRTLSLFEQLFGDYEETVTTTEKTKPPSLFGNLPNSKSKNKFEAEVKTEKPSYTTATIHYPNSHAGPSELTSEKYNYEYEDEYSAEIENTSTSTAAVEITTTTAAPTSTTVKVTSLPLGDNHISRQPIIVATQNLREQLNNEKVMPKPFGFDKPPSTSNIRIAPYEDTVSFVVGNQQNVEGTSLKESPYESNPFRPLYGQSQDSATFTVQTSLSNIGPAITIQPMQNSEASLAIGVPVDEIKQVPGQVMDEKLEAGSKIVFPDEKDEVQLPNREVLQLNSKPMYHQLPSDLTPPKEKEVIVPPPPPPQQRPRPPWDPRPGHFYSGKPEYARPPRPPRPEIAYKRIDNLPNILPQFRPNMKHSGPYLNRQPLLERPSNRPVGFFEKLQPPPPPKNLHNLRRIPPPDIAEDRIMNEPPKNLVTDQNFYQTPPIVANRRIANVEGDVETLQMIQAKQIDKKEVTPEVVTEKGTDKPLYVVYPVNTPPIKMDVIDSTNKESVVIGTRAELPLPPSQINQNFDYEQNPILNPKDRNDAPILKPHPRPSFPIKSDFPYPLERPDPSVLNPAVPETPSSDGNNIEETEFNNQWSGEKIETRVVNKPKIQTISATLKTYTEKPIAVAYTPTEPHVEDDRYSMPNYGSQVIPEIRPGTVDNVELGKPDSEITVSAVMHTQIGPKKPEINPPLPPTHKADSESSTVHPLDFQAPFQASVSIGSQSQGWAVVRDRNKSTTEDPEEVTTLPLATTSEFDIENFKPQLIGGFKPIYNFPEEPNSKQTEVSDREE